MDYLYFEHNDNICFTSLPIGKEIVFFTNKKNMYTGKVYSINKHYVVINTSKLLVEDMEAKQEYVTNIITNEK
jgi:hypothetical protein